MKEKNSGNSKIKKVFTIIRHISIFIGCVAMVAGIIIFQKGMNTFGDSTIRAFALSTKKLQPLMSDKDVTYELQARYSHADGTSSDEGNAWQRNVIFAGQGDVIEVRLKVSAPQTDDAGSEAVYRNGLSMAPFNGLNWVEPDNWRAAILPDGRRSDYMENAFDSTTQYYHIGTLRLDWGEWLYDDDATPMVKVWKSDGPEAVIYVVPPYNIVALRFGLMDLLAAGFFILILPSVLGIIEVITMRRQKAE